MNLLKSAVLGYTINFSEIQTTLEKLRDRWIGACHILPNGDAGWYRRLDVPNRIGFVATAHALISLQMIGTAVPHFEAVIRTLMARRLQDGAWPFVSNLSDVGVVDSTAWVVLALYETPDSSEFRDMELPAALRASLDWLENSSLAEGGWGITSGTTYRNYSTALAIQALCRCGRRSSSVVRHAVQRLISEADRTTGGWYDASRQLSVPVTSEVIRALSAAASEHSKYTAQVEKACEWILKVGRETAFWEASETLCHEEVEIATQTGLVRIEYGHSSRPSVLIALSTVGRANAPEAVAAMRRLLDDLKDNKWEAVAGRRFSEPMSWMLFDIVMALVLFRNAFSQNTDVVWTNTMRVIDHHRGHGKLMRAVRQYRERLLITGGCILIAWMLVKSGLVQSVGLAMLLFILSTLTLNVVSNFASDFLKSRSDKSLSRRSRS